MVLCRARCSGISYHFLGFHHLKKHAQLDPPSPVTISLTVAVCVCMFVCVSLFFFSLSLSQCSAFTLPFIGFNILWATLYVYPLLTLFNSLLHTSI